jgi:Flp pilus assembly protein TadD
VEISPEVVEASRYFAADNRNAIDDPRTHLIIGDGRSHLLLSSRRYDVIISEPSNPWMAGVAALFTREFFAAARDRLAPGGIICQWAHTYDITDGDLRSIVATFSAVFPNGTIWLIGESDILLIASTDPLDEQFSELERRWQRPGIAADLRAVSALEPFAIWSSFVAGPQELGRYAAGAAIQTDDRMQLEFSGPRAFLNGSSAGNASKLLHLLDRREAPPIVRRARAAAGATDWRDRGAMLLAAHEYSAAHDAYVRALTLDPADAGTLDGLVKTAIATHRESGTLSSLKSSLQMRGRNAALLIATSKLLAATGAVDQAIAAAQEACDITPPEPRALEQLASIYADMGNASGLEPVVARMQQTQPGRTGTLYYAAALRFIRGEFAAALDLAERAARLDPGYAEAANLIGAIQASLGHRDEARQALRAALRSNPHSNAAYTNLGLIELSSGNRTAAAEYFSEALSLDPESAAARQGLAQAR